MTIVAKSAVAVKAAIDPENVTPCLNNRGLEWPDTPVDTGERFPHLLLGQKRLLETSAKFAL